jgi:hypothetical protein
MPVAARRALSACVVALAVAGPLTAPARADGDPASDFLYFRWDFVPADAGISGPQQAQLSALLAEARRAGFPIKVAVIASAYDLGAVPELWRKPQTYARFLGTELASYYRYEGRLLVVMPNGYGVHHGRRSVRRDGETVGRLRPPGQRELGSGALTAVRLLAAKAGHRLALPRPTATSSAHGHSRSTTWIVFGAGAALVAAAWAFSLRVRPIRLRGSSKPGS